MGHLSISGQRELARSILVSERPIETATEIIGAMSAIIDQVAGSRISPSLLRTYADRLEDMPETHQQGGHA